MNFKIFLGLVACVVAVSAKKEVLHFPTNLLQLLGESSVSCIASSGMDSSWVPRLLNAEIEDRPEIRKFTFCFARGSKFADDAGHFDVNKMTSLVGSHKSKDKFKQVIEECNKSAGKDPEDIFFNVLKCFFGKTPVVFTL